RLVTGAWVGFSSPQVTFRSNYWGQGAHNALYVVGEFYRDADLPRDAEFSPPPGYQPPTSRQFAFASDDSLGGYADLDSLDWGDYDPDEWRDIEDLDADSLLADGEFSFEMDEDEPEEDSEEPSEEEFPEAEELNRQERESS